MDINSAGSLALFSYQSALQSGSQAQALQQAFQAASASGSLVGNLVGGSTDASVLSLSTQPTENLATYQLAAQAGMGAASLQSIISTPTPDQLLSAGMNSGSQGFPGVDPNVAEAWSSFQYAQAQSGIQAAAYNQQLAAAAELTASTSAMNLLA